MRGRAITLALGLVVAAIAYPGSAQDRPAASREPQRSVAETERQRALDAAARASVGPSAPGADQQRLECQAAQRNFRLLCSRRVMETAWEARECAEAAAEARTQCPGETRRP